MDPPSDRATEHILGLDPRALLARARTPERSPSREAWSPPAVEELAPLLPGFALEGFIGRGGMGAVYRARQLELDRLVAIKLFPRKAIEDAEFAERFRAEARALAKLQHPHIVTIYEAGESKDGHLYYAMEYVDGSDLSELLSRGRLSAAQALSIAHAVCEALEYAHGRGIIHRDIKPANVLLGGDGSVKVADFGLAKQFGAMGVKQGSPESHLTMTGTTLGTPSYMSPEQRAGQPVDTRADLYSLGVMLYEMLTGELPQGAWQPPSRKSDSSPRLDAVVEKTVQHDPAQRVQSAAELRARLERIGRELSPAARLRCRFMAAAAILTLAAGGIWLWRNSPPLEEPTSSAAGNQGPPVPTPPGRMPPVLAPGTYKPLEGLDLSDAAMLGAWSWKDRVPGRTLAISDTHEKPSVKILHLPLRPGPRAWDLACEVLLENQAGYLVFILPAANVRPALVLDLYDRSGLEYIRGANWITNETTFTEPLPTGRFLPITIAVRPSGERVAITVTLDGKPLLQWEGPQSDLTLNEYYYSPTLIDHRGPVLSLITKHGAAQIRAIEFRVPE